MEFRKFLELEEQPNYSTLIKGTEDVNTIGYHVSKAIFDNFDDNRLGGNTQGSYGSKHNIYSIDSLLGHQFIDNPQALLNYGNLSMLGGYMYKVNLRLGKTADLNINDLKQFFSKNDPSSVQKVQQFRQWLLQQGYGGVRITGAAVGKLMNNTLVALSSKFIQIRSVKNLKTGTELQAKNGSFAQQIQQINQQKQNAAQPQNQNPQQQTAQQAAQQNQQNPQAGPIQSQILSLINQYKNTPAGGNGWQKMMAGVQQIISQNPQMHGKIQDYLNTNLRQMGFIK